MNNRGTIKRLKGQGVFALSRGAKGGIFSIIEGGWEAAIETLPKAVANAFDCTINELDYCILHSIKDDKVVTIDFKVCSKFRPVPVLSPYWGLEMLRGGMLILKYIL